MYDHHPTGSTSNHWAEYQSQERYAPACWRSPQESTSGARSRDFWATQKDNREKIIGTSQNKGCELPDSNGTSQTCCLAEIGTYRWAVRKSGYRSACYTERNWRIAKIRHAWCKLIYDLMVLSHTSLLLQTRSLLDLPTTEVGKAILEVLAKVLKKEQATVLNRDAFLLPGIAPTIDGITNLDNTILSWEDIVADYSGLFFRVLGGGAVNTESSMTKREADPLVARKPSPQTLDDGTPFDPAVPINPAVLEVLEKVYLDLLTSKLSPEKALIRYSISLLLQRSSIHSPSTAWLRLEASFE